MRALITNDDGIDSLGLQELARCIEAEGFDVTVVAPSYDASGTGASLGHISKDRPINFKEVAVPGLSGICPRWPSCPMRHCWSFGSIWSKTGYSYFWTQPWPQHWSIGAP